jgi:ligand-binding sensor domain-containing protein
MLESGRLVLLLIILTAVTSCDGQQNNEVERTQNGDSLAVGEVVEKLEDRTWKIYQDQKDDYWFGSNGNGVFHYDGKILRKYTMKDGLIDNYIRGIQGDNLDNVFIETPEGVSKYDGTAFTSLKPIKSTANKWKMEPNDLWFNCNGNPNDVYRYDGENLYELALPQMNLMEAFGRVVLGVGFKGMNSSPYSVYGIDKDRAGNLWFGTVSAGAFRYNGESFLWIGERELSTLPDGRVPGVRSMLEDKEGYFWLSNFISKYRISVSDSIAEYEKLKGIDISGELFKDRLPYFNSGLSDGEGNLWMTTYGGGVWRYDGNELKNWRLKDGQTEVLLISIYMDNKGLIWLGTDNAGVYMFNGEAFEKFSPMKGIR